MVKVRLPTKAEWDAATPYQRGYWSYTYSNHEGSQIPSEDRNPYPVNGQEHEAFQAGVTQAILDAQDSES